MESQNYLGWKKSLRSLSLTANLTLPSGLLIHVPHLTSFAYLPQTDFGSQPEHCYRPDAVWRPCWVILSTTSAVFRASSSCWRQEHWWSNVRDFPGFQPLPADKQKTLTFRMLNSNNWSVPLYGRKKCSEDNIFLSLGNFLSFSTFSALNLKEILFFRVNPSKSEKQE